MKVWIIYKYYIFDCTADIYGVYTDYEKAKSELDSASDMVIKEIEINKFGLIDFK